MPNKWYYYCPLHFTKAETESKQDLTPGQRSGAGQRRAGNRIPGALIPKSTL